MQQYFTLNAYNCMKNILHSPYLFNFAKNNSMSACFIYHCLLPQVGQAFHVPLTAR